MKILAGYGKLSKDVYIIALSRFVNTIGAFIWPLMAVILKTVVGLKSSEIAFYVALTAGLVLGSSILGGYLSDKIGRKRVIIIFEFLAILSFASIIFVPKGIIIAYLLIIGSVFFSIAGPAHDSLMANVTKTEERESAFSLRYLALNIGVIIGPALGGFLLKDYFQLFIFIDVITTLFSYLLLVIFVKERKEKEQTNEYEKATTQSIWKILRERPVIIAYAFLMLISSFAYGQLDLTLPLYVTETFENSGSVFGILYSINGLTVVVFTVFLTYLLRKVNALNKIAVALGIYAVTNFLYAYNSSFVMLMVIMIIFTIGEIIMVIGSGPILSKIAPENQYGRATSVIHVAYTLGHILASTIAGYFIAVGYSFEQLWLIIGGLVLVGFLYYIWFRIKYGKIIKQVDKLDDNRTIA